MKLLLKGAKIEFGKDDATVFLAEIKQHTDPRTEDRQFNNFLKDCKLVANSYTSTENKMLVRG